MKALPEKLVMAAVILSCGVVAHSDPVPREGRSSRSASPGVHSPHATAGAAADRHSHLVVRAEPRRGTAP